MKRITSLLLALLMLLSSLPAFSESTEAWTPREAPAIRNAMSEAEKLAAQETILADATILFTGKTNAGYYPANIDWLTEAQPTDAIALLWACDDVTHGGWGVLGLSVNGKQLNIAAVSDQPDKERLTVYTVQELMAQAQVSSPAEITAFSLGAWNGGRIAALYFLSAEVALALNTHLDTVADAEQIIHTYNGGLSNVNAIDSAKAVYAYLQETWGTACLTGQMESTWMTSPDYEMNFIFKHTGKLPAIRGLDFMHNDFQGVVNRSIAWWKQGGIPHICWHTGSDFASGYNESKSHNLDWDAALTPGTEAYTVLLSAMDRAVPYLQQLEDAGVPVLWRPFHELDGGWFWWSKGGSDSFVRLWQLMYSRYTDYWGLDNLIWLLGYSGNGGNMAAWYPGDAYVDLIGADSYTPGANGRLYAEVAGVAPEGMPIVFHECGTIPTQAQMEAADAPWLMFMVWHTSHLTDGKSNTPASLKKIYTSEYFITLDELPAFQ
ncbi:MAG: hypothetical protein IJZ74_06020 [Clostridia bacterium]|nr:hypothetical protein [Clostridia bacterium]